MLFLWLSLFVICKIGFINGDTCTWDNCPKWNTNPSIMNIHIIPHTHDDLGWIITADDYYRREVRYILSTVTLELAKNPNRRFSYCETGYLTRWLEDFPNTGVETIKTLIQNGQLEIIGGGWVQPDEAATHYIDLVDQYTLGLRLLNNSFGSCARPKTAWQIDPFGHSREHANLMAMMGYDSLWFAREHYLEHEMRRSNRALQMMWHVSDDNQTTILTGAFYAHYNMPGGFNFDIMGGDDPIQDNPNLENYNLDEKLSTFVNDLITYNQSMLHNHIMILMGDDFTYQDANMWFTNLDKLIYHLNQNYSNILTASYSTPTCYAQAIKSISTIQWPQKYTDFFPYASGQDSLWTGYFTSKPTMKGLVRKSSALLQLIRQLQSLALTSWDVQQGAQVEALERAIALSQHHDGITGTSKQSVTQDYMIRMLQGWTSGEQVLNSAMQTISQRVKKNVVQFPQQIICRNVNESECAFTKNNNVYTVTVHNGNSQTLNALVKVPLYQATKNVAVIDYQGNPINIEISTVFTNVSQLNNTNMAPYEINFMANVGPLGFRTYFVTVTPSTNDFDPPKIEIYHNNGISAATNSISNGLIQLDFDSQGYLSTFHDLTTGKDYPLSQQFSYYRGNGPNIGNGQNSGAYAFRPNPNTPVNFTDPIQLSIVNGTIVNEARQTVSPWVSQIIRLIPNKKLVEFEWTVGPIPAGNNISKEVITTYNVNGLNTNKIFWTDANGRQLMKRTRNWGEDFTYVNYEPVAGNYYPINSRIIISDGTTSLAVLTDRSNGGSSINDGQVEIMLHRRDFYDDGYGVNEALNEPGRDGRGLVVRGKHWLVLGNAAEVTQAHRSLAYELFHAPVLTFSTYTTSSDQYRNNFVTDYAGLQQALPSNIHLLTLKQVDSSNILLRLEHIYQSMEDPTLSQPVSINLASLFSYNIVQIQELSLAANNVSSVLAGTTITLNHMDIKTYLLNVNVGNQGCTCSGSWYQSSINPCDCYSFVQTPTDWTSANNDCRKQNPRASLSSVDSAFENNELLSLLQSKTSCSQAFIGMTQQTNNVWSWINNDTSPYRNWRTGYPSGNNQCSQLNTNDGKWTNIDCTTQGCYVCEIKN